MSLWANFLHSCTKKLFKINVKKVLKIWEVFWGVGENGLFLWLAILVILVVIVKDVCPRLLSLVSLTSLAAADLFGDERKHPRFIHFTHLQQRSASAW